jgi:lipoprotein-releasing system permease protein
MFLSRVELQIAFAHLLSRRRQSLVSIGGVALGVGFLVAVSGLMRGSDADFIDRLVNSTPHITIKDEFREPRVQPVFRAYRHGAVTLSGLKPRDEVRGIKDFKGKITVIERQAGTVAAPALTGQAIMRYGAKEAGVSVSGIDPVRERIITTIADDMINGTLLALRTEKNGALIGVMLARKLGLQMGDVAIVVSTRGLVVRKKIVGIFRTGVVSVDEGQIFMPLKDAQVLLQRPNVANRIRVHLADHNKALAVSRSYETRWRYLAQSWQEANEDFLNLLVVRRGILFSIVGAIVIVATFGIYNIISTIVFEKARDIAILKSMGFRAAEILRIFILQGMVMGVIGTLAGWALGLVLLWALASVEIKVEAVVSMEGFVIYWGFDQFALAAGFAIASAIAAAWLPARKAAGVRPVEIIRGAA